MVVNIIEITSRLSKIGLSEYESRAYVALLKKNPSTPYEIAHSSGIPSSKVYEALNKLVEKSIVSSAEDGNKRLYVPLAPEELLGRYRASMNSLVDSLADDLAGIGSGSDVSYIWNIAGRDYLFDKAVRMISGAEKTLLLSVWKDDFPLLEHALKEAAKKKVRLAVVHFGQHDSSLKQIFSHPIEDTLFREKGGRVLALVTDSREVLIGTIFGDNRAEGAWSVNKGFVTVAEDYIKHDIYIMKIVKRFDRHLVKKFGERYIKLRDVFKDEEERT
ncbi:MAG TPA: helix-turn-helix domain-containing protein [Dissulfurispiraceae bacterium]|nr:helix-turn-helix domain-containing protein [Dissulfurispiraceae bacterium]